MRVRDIDLAERGLKCVGAEVRMTSRAGEEPHVRECFDVGRAQQGEKFLKGTRAVADRPDLHEDQCGRLGS